MTFRRIANQTIETRTARVPAMSLRHVAAALIAAAIPMSALGQDHTMITPDEVTWTSGPPSLPAGAEAAVLYGNPGEAELFALRLRIPEGYHIPPHTHPKPEVVTVISGTIHFGMGPEADQGATRAYEPGSFIVFEPGTAHYVYADEEVILQLNSTGPWSLEYVNPADDPRS
jgi:quercetin dioxygenase-like cupin family protein